MKGKAQVLILTVNQVNLLIERQRVQIGAVQNQNQKNKPQQKNLAPTKMLMLQGGVEASYCSTPQGKNVVFLLSFFPGPNILPDT